ncbi:MAG: asparagine synthase-related protein, partial [Planctomycetota bacterium]
LQRLDSATMLAGVEGRTPYADTGVAALAESIPAGHRFWINEEDQAHTKMPLRRAFADDLPREIVDRPKASFPVPFQRWCASEASTLLESEFLRSYFQPGSLAIVAAEPERHWNLAWPLINLSLWGEEVFGN